MHADISRDTYNPASQYSRVLMQMGRVQIDADWNEQTSILLGYMRALTRDLFGHAAGPADNCGFQIVTRDNRTSLAAVSPDVEKAVALALRAENKSDLEVDDLMIMPGRYYVGGIPVELRAPVRYRAQPGAPFRSGVTTLHDTNWIVYLELWEEFVSADQDPYLRETALGGIDTCGRARIQWRVLVGGNTDDRDPSKWSPTGSGRIKVRANPTETGDSLCSITPDARFSGAENQLYRVEIHRGGAAGPPESGATFKWSRGNGAVTFPIRRSAGAEVTLAHLGRDEWTTLTEGDWVELIDDTVVALSLGGVLAQVTSIDRDDLRVELSLPDGSALTSYSEQDAAAAHAFLRRWDHRGDAKAGGALAIVEGPEIELEDGIKIQFEPHGDYWSPGYWLIPARTATGDVEWPGGPDAPIFRRPDGPFHFRAPLAMQVQGEFKDLRCRIARLPCIGSGHTP